MNIPESFIHYVWEKMLAGQQFTMINGEKCFISKPGIKGNRDGPDFEGTELVINNKHIIGNTEIHLRSGDWYKHKHHKDSAYDNIILHVVLKYDYPIYNKQNFLIPTIELSETEILKLYKYYNKHLTFLGNDLNCRNYLSNINNIRFAEIIECLAKERLNRKVAEIKHMLEQNNYDWQETTWKAIAKTFGNPHNSVSMEWLSNTIQWKQLCRAETNLSIEAILFGQAGFLNDNFKIVDTYKTKLKQEYSHWKTLFSLKPIDLNSWKFNPIRPSSMPKVRLAQLAIIIYRYPNLFEEIISKTTKNEFYNLFQQPNSNYWSNSISANKNQPLKMEIIGQSGTDMIIINFVIPVMLAYYDYSGKTTIKNSAWDILKDIKPEKNKIINIFAQHANIIISNAFHTQGLLELYSRLCNNYLCNKCPIMTTILKN